MGCGMSTEQPAQRHANQQVYPRTTAQQNGKIKNESLDIKVKPVHVDRAVLQRYVELEKQIGQYERRNVEKSLSVKEEEYDDLNKQIEQLEEKYKQLCQQTAKEKADVDHLQDESVKSFLASRGEYDAKLSKEQEEYLDALNNQEIAKKELDSLLKKKESLQSELNSLGNEMVTLEELYQEQDELLAGIFSGTYGSDLEDKLETELDALVDHKQRVSVAKYKWQNSRVLLQYACNQLALACKRWQELANIPASNVQGRYTIATEVRNNLIAANQNITTAQKYLQTIKFPYCKAEEMETLSKATSNIYTDMHSPERHAHAFQCYRVTHKRAAALLQWFDLVINKTINNDMEKASLMVEHKQKLLRKERLRLIKEKCREQGELLDDDEYENEEFGDSQEAELAALTTSAAEADNVSNAGDLPQGDGESTNQQLGPPLSEPGVPTPLPLSELAPMPNQDVMFEDIDELKRKHEEETKEFLKAQEMNKSRMEQGLKEKLQARRSHRHRQKIQEDQAKQLVN